MEVSENVVSGEEREKSHNVISYVIVVVAAVAVCVLIQSMVSEGESEVVLSSWNLNLCLWSTIEPRLSGPCGTNPCSDKSSNNLNKDSI